MSYVTLPVMADIVISEPLCFLCNYFGKVAKSVLITNVAGFYEENEIVEAKNVLFNVVTTMKLGLDDVPRNKQRKSGDNKRRLDVDDIMTMLEFLDVKKVSLPDFVAKNVRRLPSICPTDVETYKWVEAVSEVKTQLADVQLMLKTLSDNQAILAKTVSSVAGMAASTKQSDVPYNLPVSSADNMGSGTSASLSFVDMFANKDDEGEWFPPKTVKKQNGRAVRRIVGGNNSTDLKVKAVTGSAEWHVFAGRLDPTTTEGDLIDMLTSKNINVVSCKMLRKTEDWHHKYAAFRVVVDVGDKDNVFNDSVWPVGADVRDWWFSSKHS